MHRLTPWAGVALMVSTMFGLFWSDYTALREERITQARHAAIIEAIVEAAKDLAITDVSSAIEVRFGAKDVHVAPPLMLSDPPKLALAFTLNGVRHSVTYTPNYPKVRAMKVPEGQ